ncbi:MAG: hypothetical protein ACK463_01950, partial [Bradyrhizobium sp.]
FSEQHPLPGVWIGKNCVMVGDLASVPVFLRDGTLLVPVIITPIGPDGTYHNPGGGVGPPAVPGPPAGESRGCVTHLRLRGDNTDLRHLESRTISSSSWRKP